MKQTTPDHIRKYVDIARMRAQVVAFVKRFVRNTRNTVETHVKELDGALLSRSWLCGKPARGPLLKGCGLRVPQLQRRALAFDVHDRQHQRRALFFYIRDRPSHGLTSLREHCRSSSSS